MKSNISVRTDNLRRESIKGFVWRFVQSISAQVMSFIIQIVLARLLLPSDYGIIALTSTFVTILNVIISTGFTSALVQQKEISDLEKSSMFFLSVFIGVLLYIVVFVSSPFFAAFYQEALLIDVLRVQGLSLVIVSFMSVHSALIQRGLQFKITFLSGLVAVVAQGIVGITMALKGFGVWALVWATVVQNLVDCLMLFLLYKWRPKLQFSFSSIKRMMSFSSKVLAGNVLNAVYNSSKTLVIGRVYDKEVVGFYNRGNQFPSVVMTGFDGSVSAVLFSSLSKIQDDQERLLAYLRRGLKISLAVCVPLMCGMAAVADPMINALLTEKWASAVPFVMMECLLCLAWPLAARAQALNAIGKSGVNLAINIVIKLISLILLFASIPFGIYVMCLSSLLATFISFVVYSVVLKRFLNYSIRLQLLDVLPTYGIGLIMFLIIYGLSALLVCNVFLELFFLVLIGAVLYIALCFLFRIEGFMYIMNMLFSALHRRKKQKDWSRF